MLDVWWDALPWAERLHMQRLMFRPLARVVHVGIYFLLSARATVANDNGDWPPRWGA